MINLVQKLIKDICNEENINCSFISEDWITVLEKNGKTRIIAGYKFDLNRQAVSKVFDDKYATYELLSLYNIPVVEHKLLYPNNNRQIYAINKNNTNYLKKCFNQFNNNVVIKINNGTCGLNVNHFDDFKSLKNFYENLNSESSYSICPFYDIENEYRVIVLNNNIRLIYKKNLPIIYGDGTLTIKELLLKYNYEYFKNYNGKDKNVILKNNEMYQYGWKFNLSNGAKVSFEIDKDIQIEIENIMKKLTKNIDICFCSVDIIKTSDNKYLVLEINSGVMMKNLFIENENIRNEVKQIYKDAIRLMFEKEQ